MMKGQVSLRNAQVPESTGGKSTGGEPTGKATGGDPTGKSTGGDPTGKSTGSWVGVAGASTGVGMTVPTVADGEGTGGFVARAS